MGTKVTVTLDDQLKPNYTVATQLAGAFAIGTTELVVWIGAETLAQGKSNQVSGVIRAAELIKENGYATPTTTNVTLVAMKAPVAYKPNATVVVNGAVPVIAESEIVVGYGSAFQGIPGAAVTAHIRRALEKFVEQRA